ncbi:hypothetical protein Gotur_013713 [Gossypium turneri]
MVRFSCGRYGHVRKMCPKKATETSQSEVEVLTVAKENSVGDLVAYGPWMVINRKSRWSSRPNCSQQAFVLGSEGMTLDLGLLSFSINSGDKWGKGEGPSKNKNNKVAVGAQCGSVLTVVHLAFYNPNLGIEERQAKEMGNQPISPSIFIFTESGEAHPNISYVNFNIPVVNENIKDGMDVPLKEGVLDPSKHLTISFKEKLTAVEGKALKVNNLIKLVKGIHVGRGRGNGGKNDSNRNGKFPNMTLRGHGERSKASGNSCFPLSDTMNSMAELISSQIDIVGDTRAQSRNEKGLESLSSAK